MSSWHVEVNMPTHGAYVSTAYHKEMHVCVCVFVWVCVHKNLQDQLPDLQAAPQPAARQEAPAVMALGTQQQGKQQQRQQGAFH